MDELKYYERIEAYEENKLSPYERIAFERDLELDEEFKLEYEAYLMSNEVSFVLGYEQLKENQTAKELSINEPSRSINLKWYLVAASIILICGFTAYWANQSYSNMALASNEFTETNVSSSRSAKESDQLKLIKDAFEQGNYNRVIDMARTINKSDSVYAMAQFIAGHAFVKLGKYVNAIPGLKVMASAENNLNSGNAQWNLALCYIMTEQVEKAVIVLEDIVNDPTADYQTKAIALLGKLKSFWRNLII